MLGNHPDMSTTAAVVRFLSYFTILSNLWVTLGFTLPLLAPKSAIGGFFATASTRGASAVYIVIVGVTYSLLLRHLLHLQSWAKVADVIVHHGMPVFYLGYWFLFAPKSALRWKDAAAWLLYPLAYLIYTLLHGAYTGWYPYPFLNVTGLGYRQTLANVAVFVVAFLGLGLLIVAIGRWKSEVPTPVAEEAE
jgi:hypothetical protein